MDIAFVKVRSDRTHVECYSTSGNFVTSFHPATACPIRTAMIQGDKIVIQGDNGKTDIYDLHAANFIMSV